MNTLNGCIKSLLVKMVFEEYAPDDDKLDIARHINKQSYDDILIKGFACVYSYDNKKKKRRLL